MADDPAAPRPATRRPAAPDPVPAGPAPARPADLLADRTPFPAGLGQRLHDQLTFLVEIDQMKAVLRQSPLAAAERRENDAEHSWHLALMVLVLAEYSDEPLDVGRAAELVLVHDLVEVYAGDTPVYDAAAVTRQRDRELAAADRLFTLLPADQAVVLRARWDEFEERRSPEARFAKAMDRLQPLLLNWMARGGTWRRPGVTADDVRARKALIGDASTELGAVARQLIDEGERRGWSRPGARLRAAPGPPGDGGPARG
jgi:putative hydrolase of HD superfamily